MKKTTMTVATLLLLAGTLSLNSCIGSFALTKKVMTWNNQVGNKFLNELVFFAFWVLPVYEVTALADVLVINSIEFWSGSNPMEASTKVIDTEHGRYLIACDGKGYDITLERTGESFRLDFSESEQTWSLVTEEASYPIMTFVDDNHVKMVQPDGDMRMVDLTEQGVMAYAALGR
ncbi:MAG: DUF3332 domain-containing protein [Bacteroides sp.]|nr:DUF3332 domain-containing protein [Bacteroides sp.]